MSADQPPRPPKTHRDLDPTEVQPGLGTRPPDADSAVPADRVRRRPAGPTPADAPPYRVPGYEDWRLLGSRHLRRGVAPGGDGQRSPWPSSSSSPAPARSSTRCGGWQLLAPIRPASSAWRASTPTPRCRTWSWSTPTTARSPAGWSGTPPPAPSPKRRGGARTLFLPPSPPRGGGRGGRGPNACRSTRRCRFFREIAEALAYVHSKGILHCDLKPANVLLDSRDQVRLADFGQAQLASELTPSLGTFFYMAPEQARHRRRRSPTTRWDVYALGAILYQMLTGRLPRHDDELAAHPAEDGQPGRAPGTVPQPDRVAAAADRPPPRPRRRSRPGRHRRSLPGAGPGEALRRRQRRAGRPAPPRAAPQAAADVRLRHRRAAAAAEPGAGPAGIAGPSGPRASRRTAWRGSASPATGTPPASWRRPCSATCAVRLDDASRRWLAPGAAAEVPAALGRAKDREADGEVPRRAAAARRHGASRPTCSTAPG